MTMIAKILPAAILVSLLTLACPLQAKDYFVEQKNAVADDKNPGTEAKPFKTIQQAVDAAKPGDAVYVKAGVYPDSVNIRTSGTPNHPITLTAWKDDRVVVGAEPVDLPPAEQWKAVDGHKSYQVQLPPDTPKDVIVVLDGKAIVTEAKDAPPNDDDLNWATYRASDRTLMVNTGEGNPAAMHKIQRGRNIEPFTVGVDASFWQIKKMEFAWSTTSFVLYGTGILVEDCYFHDSWRIGFFLHARLCTIRRCNFFHSSLGASGAGPSHLIEDCLFVQGGMEAVDDINARASRNLTDGGGGPIGFKGLSTGMIIRYNIIADSRGGLWHDGTSSGVRIIGNAFWNCSGIYNEYGVNDTLAIGNYFYRACMSSSWSTRMTVVDNFFDNVFNGGVRWHNRDVWPLRYGYMTVRGNAFTGLHQGYLGGSDRGEDSLYPEGWARAFVDYNRARVLPNDWICFVGKTGILKSLEELQNKYGFDLHGEVKFCEPKDNDLTPESMGGSTVTFRLPWGPRAHLARPMLADAKIDGKWPAVPEYSSGRMPAFFWRVVDGDYNPDTLAGQYSECDFELKWAPNCSAGYAQGENHGVSFYVGAEDKYPDPKMHIDGDANRSEMSSGNRWLVMRGVTSKEIPACGVGWWTPYLATAPGAKINVSFNIRTKDMAPTENGTAAVYMQFINARGQQRTRSWIIGLDEAGKTQRPELTKGSTDWTEVKQTITAPDTAVRMALFLGIRPSTGELNFDDINIKTDDGPKPQGDIEIVEALPPQIAKERMRDIIYLDLSKAANRSLVSPAAGDGKGWTDQGPDLDMRKFPTGDKNFGTVPFRLLSGDKAVLVLKGNGKAGADLSREVTIPVGGKKIEGLYVLYASAFLTRENKALFKATVKYKDGTTTQRDIHPGILADWLAEPVRYFKDDYTTTAAYTVPVGKADKGTVYRTEWILDRAKHDVPVESITIEGTDKGVPLILGLTGVTQW
jgi:hypothetical protein